MFIFFFLFFFSYSQGSHFSYIAKKKNKKKKKTKKKKKKKKKLPSDRYTADFFCIYKAWILHETKPPYSNPKQITIWRYVWDLHVLFSIVLYVKHIVNRYILTDK